MSWSDRLDNIKFTIITGDGKVYTPLWKSTEKSKDYNVSRQDHINVSGSFIDKRRPQGGKFPLMFYFQGDDNIDQSNEFEISADDSRLWTVEHPFYGTVKGQPVNIKRNDTSYNSTEVTVDFWESTELDSPSSTVSASDDVRSRFNDLNINNVAVFVENAEPVTGDIQQMKDDILVVASKHHPDEGSFNSYTNTVKTAIKTADDLLSDTETSFRNSQNVITEPSSFVDKVSRKISDYVESYGVLKNSVSDVFDKVYFETQAASLIGGMCDCAVNPIEGDYVTRSDIESVNDSISETYSDYLATMDENQVTVYDVDESWSPNVVVQSDISGLVSFTSSSLFLLSFDARQEREYELTEDSNIILLAHRFMGLDPDDKNIDTFRQINQIKNDELFKIRKGRVVRYFV